MRGRAFLGLARQVMSGGTEVHWRAAAIHAYYALVLECRDALLRWGFTTPRQNMHADVRLRFSYSTEPDPKQTGYFLDELARRRNQASYDLRSSTVFASALKAQDMIKLSTNGLALLDAIEADPARRAAAVASIRP